MRRERGAAVVDFVLVLVVLVPLVLGILQVALVLQVRNTAGGGRLGGRPGRRDRRPRAGRRGGRDAGADRRGDRGSVRRGRQRPRRSPSTGARDRGHRPRPDPGARAGRPGDRGRGVGAGGRGAGAVIDCARRRQDGSAVVELVWLGHPAAGADPVDRAVGLRGAEGRLRGVRRRPLGRPGLRARAHRRRGGAASPGGGRAGAGRPGARGRAAGGDGDAARRTPTTATAAPR